ncbi:hypothetical protein EMIT0111MI5_40297 [Burkholderia sp. IT-111MI5]
MKRCNTLLFILFSKWKRDTLARVSPPDGRPGMPGRRRAHLGGFAPNSEWSGVLFVI